MRCSWVYLRLSCACHFQQRWLYSACGVRRDEDGEQIPYGDGACRDLVYGLDVILRKKAILPRRYRFFIS